MLSFIKKFDFFGHPINFEYHEANTFKTFQGLLISFLVLIPIIVLGAMFGNDLFRREAPFVFLSNEIYNDVELKMTDFPFFVSFFYNNGINLAPFNSYFDVDITNYINEDNLYVEKNLTLISCKEVKFTDHDEIVQNFMLNRSEEFMCLNSSSTTKTKGKFPNGSSSVIRIRLDFCDPLKREDCKINQEIISSQPVIQNYYLNSIVNSKNYTHPVNYIIERFINGLSYGVSKDFEFIFSKDLYVSDNGWLIQSKVETNYFSLVTINRNFNLAINQELNKFINSRSVYSFNMKLSTIRQVNNRSYIKVQELIARIGGIVNALLVFTKIIAYNYLRYLFLFFVRKSIIEIQVKKSSQSIFEVSKFKSGNIYRKSQIFKDISLNNLSENKNESNNIQENEPVSNVIVPSKFKPQKQTSIKSLNEEDQNSYKSNEKFEFGYFNFLYYTLLYWKSKSKRMIYIKSQMEMIKEFIDVKSIFALIEHQKYESTGPGKQDLMLT